MVATGLTPETPVANEVHIFFKEFGDQKTCSDDRFDNFKQFLINQGVTVHSYQNPLAPGDIFFMAARKKFLTREMPMEISYIPDEDGDTELLEYKRKEYESSAKLETLEAILNQFCSTAQEDSMESTDDAIDQILKGYKREDWSKKIERTSLQMKSLYGSPSDDLVRQRSSSRILLLTGEQGIGKTCFLARWVEQFQKARAATPILSTSYDTLSTEEDRTPIFGEGQKSLYRGEIYPEIHRSNFSSETAAPSPISPYIITHFAVPNDASSDVWTTLDRLTEKVRAFRGKSVDLKTDSPSTLSALTVGLSDAERARQLRQLGARFFASMRPDVNQKGNSTNSQSTAPLVIVIDGVDNLEDPLASSFDGIKCVDWLFSCHAPQGMAEMNDVTNTRSGGLPIVPPGVRLILSCSSTNMVCERLSRCSCIRVVPFPVEVPFKKHKRTRFNLPSAEGYGSGAADLSNAQQPADLVKYMPSLSQWTTDSENGLSTSYIQFADEDDERPMERRERIVHNRIADRVAIRAYEQWPLRHNPLARKMLAHEMHTTSFGFGWTQTPQEMAQWNDYRDRLLATQSIRQLIICLVQRWAVEFETELLETDWKPEYCVKDFVLHNDPLGDLLTPGTTETGGISTVAVGYLTNRAKKSVIKRITKEWTNGFIGLVLHICLAANEFTWPRANGCDSHGFRMDDVLEMARAMPQLKNSVMHRAPVSTIAGFCSALLPYQLLRLFHRAGAFNRNTGGSILRQTCNDGYLVFGHEIIQIVLHQILSRDGGATGVQLPLGSFILKWTGGGRGETLQNFVDKYRDRIYLLPRDICLTPVAHRSENSPRKFKPRVTFRQIGGTIRALVALENRHEEYRSLFSPSRERSTRHQAGDVYALMNGTKSDNSSDYQNSPSASSEVSLPLSKSSYDSLSEIEEHGTDGRAQFRHSTLLETALDATRKKADIYKNNAFVSRAVASLVARASAFANFHSLKSVLRDLHSLFLSPCAILCLCCPEFKEHAFLGNISNSHLVIAYWRFTKRSISIVQKNSKQRNSPVVSLSTFDTTPISPERISPVVPDTKTVSGSYENEGMEFQVLGRDCLKVLKYKASGRDQFEIKALIGKNWARLHELEELPGENIFESFTWVCAELLYLLGEEEEAIDILLELASLFLERKSNKAPDIAQLSHLGLSIAVKQKRLPLSLQYLCSKTMPVLRLIGMKIGRQLQICLSTGRCDPWLDVAKVVSVHVFVKLLRIEELIMIRTDAFGLESLDFLIDGAMAFLSKYNPRAVCGMMKALSLVLHANIRLWMSDNAHFEGLMLQALKCMIVDEGEYHPRLAEWIIQLTQTLSLPQNEDIPDEASFLRLASRRAKAESFVRWGLDIMAQRRILTTRPPGRPPNHMTDEFQSPFDMEVHKSLLQRLPRLSPLYLRSDNHWSNSSEKLGDSEMGYMGSLLSETSDDNMDYSCEHVPTTPGKKYVGDVRTTATKLRLRLVDCLLESGYKLGLQEAAEHLGMVLHERVTFLGVENPATAQVTELLHLVEQRSSVLELPGQISASVAKTISRRNEEARVAHAQVSDKTLSTGPSTSQRQSDDYDFAQSTSESTWASSGSATYRDKIWRSKALSGPRSSSSHAKSVTSSSETRPLSLHKTPGLGDQQPKAILRSTLSSYPPIFVPDVRNNKPVYRFGDVRSARENAHKIIENWAAKTPLAHRPSRRSKFHSANRYIPSGGVLRTQGSYLIP
ncbi:unnamed protein product [Calicophoron daubneyi]